MIEAINAKTLIATKENIIPVSTMLTFRTLNLETNVLAKNDKIPQ